MNVTQYQNVFIYSSEVWRSTILYILRPNQPLSNFIPNIIWRNIFNIFQFSFFSIHRIFYYIWKIVCTKYTKTGDSHIILINDCDLSTCIYSIENITIYSMCTICTVHSAQCTSYHITRHTINGCVRCKMIILLLDWLQLFGSVRSQLSNTNNSLG